MTVRRGDAEGATRQLPQAMCMQAGQLAVVVEWVVLRRRDGEVWAQRQQVKGVRARWARVVRAARCGIVLPRLVGGARERVWDAA